MSTALASKSKRADEAVDALRLRVLAREGKRAQRNDALVVLLTSRLSEEGVTTVAAALARAFAKKGDGRVLLIDADVVSKDLVKRAPAREAIVIESAEQLDPEVEIKPVNGWNVDLVGLATSSDGGQAFDANRWEKFTSGLRSRYDIIVVDAGTLKSGVPQFWSDSASQIVLVIDSSRTSVNALERLRKELKDAGMTLSGVIMNKREYPIPSLFY